LPAIIVLRYFLFIVKFSPYISTGYFAPFLYLFFAGG